MQFIHDLRSLQLTIDFTKDDILDTLHLYIDSVQLVQWISIQINDIVSRAGAGRGEARSVGLSGSLMARSDVNGEEH